MKLSEMNLQELSAIYSVATDICREYSKMTDGYILATGDNILDRITNELKKRLLTEIEYE